jgi:hypothetical protein
VEQREQGRRAPAQTTGGPAPRQAAAPETSSHAAINSAQERRHPDKTARDRQAPTVVADRAAWRAGRR